MRHCLQKDVALAIGMSEQVFSNKMNGLRSFSAKDYKALAEKQKASVDTFLAKDFPKGQVFWADTARYEANFAMNIYSLCPN